MVPIANAQPGRAGSRPMGWEAGSTYRSRTTVNAKILDFIKSGGPVLMVGSTIFELWLGRV